MSYVIEATYENGVLKLDQPLPLPDLQRVKVVVDDQVSLARKSYGVIEWKGDVETLNKLAMDPEFGIMESP